jgi:hypothetical protein
LVSFHPRNERRNHPKERLDSILFHSVLKTDRPYMNYMNGIRKTFTTDDTGTFRGVLILDITATPGARSASQGTNLLYAASDRPAYRTAYVRMQSVGLTAACPCAAMSSVYIYSFTTE